MQPNKKNKSVSVKDKLDGNEIDLSLLELTEVPVKELVFWFPFPPRLLHIIIMTISHTGCSYSRYRFGSFQQQAHHPQRKCPVDS